MTRLDESAIRCTECGRGVDEFTTIAEVWLDFYDSRDLFPYCPPWLRVSSLKTIVRLRSGPGGTRSDV